MKDYLVCPDCKTVVAINVDPDEDNEISFCLCEKEDGYLVTGQELNVFFPEFAPSSPKVGELIELPSAKFFEAQELLNILVHGDASWSDNQKLTPDSSIHEELCAN